MSESVTDVIVAIDPSLSKTAIVIGAKRFSEMTTCGSVPCGDSVADRIKRFHRQARQVCDLSWMLTKNVRVTAVYIEGYSMGSTGKITSICEYGGILREHLLRFTDRIYEVAPSTLKKFAIGKGTGSKDMVAAHLTKRYGVLLNSNDEYDAYGLYRLGLVAEGWEEAANQAQREAVDTVLGLNVKPKKKRAS